MLVPYYTHELSTAEYGIADVVATTSSMLMPIITLSIAEAALRFAMDRSENSGRVFMNSITVVVIGNTVLMAFLSAVEEMTSKDKSDFYSKTFSYYSALLLIASSFVTMII